MPINFPTEAQRNALRLMPINPEEVGDDIENWFYDEYDDFENEVYELRKRGATDLIQEAATCFEEKIAFAAKAGIEHMYAYALAGRYSRSPRRRYAYFARAYELRIEENRVKQYSDLESSIRCHAVLADYAYEMARIHEADGEMKQAAELYERSLQHLQDAADVGDAQTNYEGGRGPRRPGYTASLERVRKFLP
jgi:hypothetical protein